MLVNSGFAFQRFTYSEPPAPPGPESLGTTYKTITINKTYVPSTQTNYVARISANLFTSDFFTKLSSGGSARFTLSDGTTQIPHEKIYLDTSGSKGYYNVLVPTVNGTAEGSSTDIRVYYENTLSDLDSTSANGRNAVWANNYKCVQHLHTTPNLTQVNSTGNSSYDMTNVGSLLSTDTVTAQYGGGTAHFYDAPNQGVKVNHCDITGFPFSLGLLFRTPNDGGDNGYICAITDSATSAGAFALNKVGVKSDQTLYGWANDLTSSPYAASMQSTTWNLAVVVFTSISSRTLYFNTVTPATNTGTGSAYINGNAVCIAYMDWTTDGYFNGDLAVQDFFLTSEALTANRYTTMYNNYFNGSFFTIT